MDSNGMYRVNTTKSDSLKVRKAISGTHTGATTYYWKPKGKVYLLGAELTLLTNTGSGTTVSVTRTNITSGTQPGEIMASTGITATDISSSTLLTYTLPASATTTTEFEPGTNLTSAWLTIDPNATSTDLTTNGNALKITVADMGTGSEAMTGILTLEYMPIL
jgi:hypothetical protein